MPKSPSRLDSEANHINQNHNYQWSIRSTIIPAIFTPGTYGAKDPHFHTSLAPKGPGRSFFSTWMTHHLFNNLPHRRDAGDEPRDLA
jgi:hypothetical protein